MSYSMSQHEKLNCIRISYHDINFYVAICRLCHAALVMSYVSNIIYKDLSMMFFTAQERMESKQHN